MQGAVIFYFSGTGNTAWVSKRLARALTEKGVPAQAYNIEQIKPEQLRALVKGKKYVCFGYPVYGSDIPRPMKDFVLRFPALSQRQVFVFCTQMMFSGDGARALQPFLRRAKGKIRYAEHFNMPNNISIEKYGFHATNDMEHIRPILEKTGEKIALFAQNIAEETPLRRGCNIGSHMLGLVQRLPFRALYSGLQKSLSIDKSRCTACGKCAANCPVGNIRPEDGAYAIGDKCCLCMRCCNYCDFDAVLFRGSRTSTTPYKGLEDFEKELSAIKDRTDHGSLPMQQNRRYSGIIRDANGSLTKGFKIFLTVLALNALLVVLLSTVPFEVRYVLRHFIWLTVYLPILLMVFVPLLKDKKIKKLKDIASTVFCTLMVTGLLYTVGHDVITCFLDL